MLMEKEERAAGENAIILSELGSLGALAAYRGAVLRAQVLDHVVPALARDYEVTPREGVVRDDQVSRGITSNGDWLIANVPPPGHGSILT